MHSPHKSRSGRIEELCDGRSRFGAQTRGGVMARRMLVMGRKVTALVSKSGRIRANTVRVLAATMLALTVAAQGALTCAGAQTFGLTGMVGCASNCPLHSGAHHPSCCQASSHPVQLQVTPRAQPAPGADFSVAISALSFLRAMRTACATVRDVSFRPPPMLTLAALCSLQI